MRENKVISRAFARIGYGVVCLISIILLVELFSAAGIGFYYGSYLRSRNLAPELRAPRGEPPAVFSLRSLIQEDFSSASPAFDEYPWAEEHWKELRAATSQWKVRYEPFLVWSNSGFHGKFINVDDADDGAWRRTVNSCAANTSPALRIWVFGGSTMFSGDNPDFTTIPSILARKLNSDPKRCVEVTNLGVAGYSTNQEVLLLMRRLKSGKRPDIVIFYDGFNEAYVGAFSPGLPAAHHNFIPIKTRLEKPWSLADLIQSSHALRIARVLVGKIPHLQPAEGPLDQEAALAAKAVSTMDNYEWNLGLVKALAGTYGFKAHFFWQPTLAYGKKTRSGFESTYLATPVLTPKEQLRAIAAVYREAERRSVARGGFVNLAHLFDQRKETIYIDSIHVGPLGNAIVADAIASHLR